MAGRFIFKAIALLIVVVYCIVFVYLVRRDAHVPSSRGRTVQLEAAIEADRWHSTIPVDHSKAQLALTDLFISVKTTKHNEQTRLSIVFKTWFTLAKEQIWFFTDTDNLQHQKVTNGHMVNTNCSASHQRKHLCCKLSVEYDYFIESKKKWFCHFDDDNYVNVPRLFEVLQQYDPQLEWYLGRTSIVEPVKIYKKPTNQYMFSFWFATGGAGFCLSRALAFKMIPVASGGRFMSICEDIRMPDDVSMGFIIDHMLKKKLTVVKEFHSHLEQMKLISPDVFAQQISFSYSKFGSVWNVVEVDGFDSHYDPTRFLSLHCFLFPAAEFCPR